MLNFLQNISTIAWLVVLILLALAVIAARWERVKWWWHNTWYSFPLIGAIATLSRNTRPDPERPNWFESEKTLCTDYSKYLGLQSEHVFQERKTYLNLAEDNGRSPTPVFIWIFLLIL